ncbi:MAG: adenylate/guanylate cyclase domain-containing protein [Pseudomonadaceae bacterium]|nr:adenylate/guanylate cyclase domain-containing protein [Pseudomonadaceae bacterium]
MRLRHLNRYAWPVRRASFPAFSLVLLSLIGSGRPLLLVLACCSLMATWPLLVSCWTSQQRAAEESNYHRVLLASECLLASFVCGLLCVPELVLATVCISLLSAAALLLGAHPLALCAAGLCSGFALGCFASPVDPEQVTAPGVTDVLSFGLLLWLVVGVSLAAHRQSLRLAGERGRAIQRAVHLDGYTSRLTRYLPSELTTRLFQQPAETQPARLSRRAWLSVVFVDLCGFSGLTERLEPEELAGILNAYLDGVASYAERFGAQIGHIAGDGVLVYFEAKSQSGKALTAHQATGFAREVQRYCADQLAVEWRLHGVFTQPALRTGVASGHCTLADWGGRRLDYTPIGSPVNRAARLQRQSDVGGVGVDAATSALLSIGSHSPRAEHSPQSDADEAHAGDQR